MRPDVQINCYTKDGKKVNSSEVKVPLHICEAIHRISENIRKRNEENVSSAS